MPKRYSSVFKLQKNAIARMNMRCQYTAISAGWRYPRRDVIGQDVDVGNGELLVSGSRPRTLHPLLRGAHVVTVQRRGPLQGFKRWLKVAVLQELDEKGKA